MEEYETLVELADVLVPGAKQAGIGLFLDHHLSVKREHCLLMIGYLGVPSPYIDFYSSSLDNIRSYCRSTYKAPVTQLTLQQKQSLVDAIAQDAILEWQGFPASFFHFVLRADAADVVYGTVSGFERLGIPYSAHISPTSNW